MVPTLHRIFMLLDEQGRPFHRAVVVTDITEQKQAEAALRESEKCFKDLAQLLPQTVFEMDLEGRLTFVNRQALEMFGYTRAEIESGLSCFDVFAPKDRERAAPQHTSSSWGRGCREENRIHVPTEERGQFPAIAYGLPIHHDQVSVGVRGILVDMTERKTDRRGPARERGTFPLPDRDAPEAVFVVSAERFAYLNPAACRLFGASRPEELVGRTPWRGSLRSTTAPSGR